MDTYNKIIPDVINHIDRMHGDKFLQSISRELSLAIEADYTFIARLTNDTTSSETVSLCAKDKFMDNFSYELKNTPCQQISDDSACIYPSNISSLFPNDQLLIDMNIEGYIGSPLHSKDGTVIGLVVALYKTKIVDANLVSSIFQFFSGRISAELENTYQKK